MKKVFLTLALVFATSTVLVSCGGSEEGSGNEEGTEESADTAGDEEVDGSGDATGNE